MSYYIFSHTYSLFSYLSNILASYFANSTNYIMYNTFQFVCATKNFQLPAEYAFVLLISYVVVNEHTFGINKQHSYLTTAGI